MSFIGTVTENGTIALPPEAKLPAGTQVRIEPLQGDESVWDVLTNFDGKAKGLPADMAANHDHYAHGTPKRS